MKRHPFVALNCSSDRVMIEGKWHLIASVRVCKPVLKSSKGVCLGLFSSADLSHRFGIRKVIIK